MVKLGIRGEEEQIMAEEMILEDVPYESDEAGYFESDEGIIESEDSAEDIGDRAQSRRRQRRYFRPGRGVQGISLRTQDGKVRKLPFPTKLATAAETNRGLASQEIARRTLDQRLKRLETMVRVQGKNDSAVAGVVTLLIGGGLSAWGAYQASQTQGGSLSGRWASQEATRAAAVISVGKLATSGATVAIKGQYPGGGFNVAADVASAVQLTVFAIGSLYRPIESTQVNDLAALQAAIAAGAVMVDHRYVAQDTALEYDTFRDSAGRVSIRLVR